MYLSFSLVLFFFSVCFLPFALYLLIPHQMLLHVVADSINRSKKNNATNIIIMFCRFCKSHDARPALLYQPRIHESTQSKRYESHYRRTCYIHFIALVFPFLWYLFAAQDRSKAATKRLSRFIFTRDCILQRGSTFLRDYSGLFNAEFTCNILPGDIQRSFRMRKQRVSFVWSRLDPRPTDGTV